MANKICCRCKKEKLLSEFCTNKTQQDGVHYQCKKCRQKYDQLYRKAHRKEIRKRDKQYYHTLNGYLRRVYAGMKRRCNNPRHVSYKNYGGRGIKNKFTSDEFVDYVINTLGYNTYEKIKGLQIDRIDNDGHYEKGNIRFVTAKENANNRRERNAF